MLKTLATIVVSVVLSVSSILGLVHVMPQASEDFSTIKAATRQVEGTVNGPFGMSLTSCTATSIAPDIHLTAAHCLSDNLKVNGVAAVVLKMDLASDLLLLYADTDDAYVPVARDVFVSEGLEVTSYGYPFGFIIGYVPVLTQGVVQGNVKGDPMWGTDRFNGWMVMQLLIDGGNSGGGIFVNKGGKWELLSVVSMGSKHLAISPTNKMVKDFLK